MERVDFFYNFSCVLNQTIFHYLDLFNLVINFKNLLFVSQ